MEFIVSVERDNKITMKDLANIEKKRFLKSAKKIKRKENCMKFFQIS